jgi:hypothetical protein
MAFDGAEDRLNSSALLFLGELLPPEENWNDEMEEGRKMSKSFVYSFKGEGVSM